MPSKLVVAPGTRMLWRSARCRFRLFLNRQSQTVAEDMGGLRLVTGHLLPLASENADRDRKRAVRPFGALRLVGHAYSVHLTEVPPGLPVGPPKNPARFQNRSLGFAS